MRKNQRPHADWVYEGFPKWLQDRLAEREWTASRLASAMGVTTPLISRWMTGKHHPSPESIRALASALSVSPLEVLAAAGYLDMDEIGDDPRRLELIKKLKRVDLTHERYVTLNALIEVMTSITSPRENAESWNHRVSVVAFDGGTAEAGQYSRVGSPSH